MSNPDPANPQDAGDSVFGGSGSNDAGFNNAGFTDAGGPAPDSVPPGLNAIMVGVVADAQTLIQDVLALGQAELKPMGKHVGVGVGLFAGAAFFALNALILLFSAGALGIAKLFGATSGWLALGFVIMGVVLLALAAILGLIGKGQVSSVGPPTHTIAAARNAVDSVQQAVSRGVAAAKTRELTAKNFGVQSVIDRSQSGDHS